MKKKILTIVGARPQIIKAAAFSRAVRTHFSEQLEERLLHTGQHYDHGMSQVFFDEMGIPMPDIQLNLGGGSHGEQTARMLDAIERELLQDRPDAVLIYGDTNSTLAGALAASKLHIPVIHVEAGLRSFNKTMPEEINRITADHVSSLLFVPTPTGLKNLEHEGFDLDYMGAGSLNKPRVILCGDVMYDNAIYYRQLAGKQSGVLDQVGSERFMLATIHRDHNTDHPERLFSILTGLHNAAAQLNWKIVLPLHPRTAKMLGQPEFSESAAILNSSNMCVIPPVSYLDMIRLESNAEAIATDSGGVQKEAYFYRKPCVILRPETEWVELLSKGHAILANTDERIISDALIQYAKQRPTEWPEYYGNGSAAVQICEHIIQSLA